MGLVTSTPQTNKLELDYTVLIAASKLFGRSSDSSTVEQRCIQETCHSTEDEGSRKSSDIGSENNKRQPARYESS